MINQIWPKVERNKVWHLFYNPKVLSDVLTLFDFLFLQQFVVLWIFAQKPSSGGAYTIQYINSLMIFSIIISTVMRNMFVIVFERCPLIAMLRVTRWNSNVSNCPWSIGDFLKRTWAETKNGFCISSWHFFLLFAANMQIFKAIMLCFYAANSSGVE